MPLFVCLYLSVTLSFSSVSVSLLLFHVNPCAVYQGAVTFASGSALVSGGVEVVFALCVWCVTVPKVKYPASRAAGRHTADPELAQAKKAFYEESKALELVKKMAFELERS
jgi:hypothetical protein